jgi:predicted alpha/beta-hydrolase family hydrolase
MDSPFMDEVSAALAAEGVEVIRFEFAYMAARRTGARKPPPRADKLTQEFIDVLGEIETDRPVFIGGKSMGGRVASLVAEDLYRSGRIAGLICLGYPFHPPARPDSLRTAHLKSLTVPALICQGTRDPFGTRGEVEGYGLSEAIGLFWLDDGDHDFKPRKKSGLIQAEHISAAAEAIADWMEKSVSSVS